MNLATASGIVASIVPSDPTSGIAVVATAVLTLFIAVMTFLAVAPLVSTEWAERLGTVSDAGSSLETNEAD